MKSRMGNPEYLDLICLVHAHWAALADFYTRGVANVVGQQEFDAIKALSGVGILNHQLKINGNRREAIAEVSGGRPTYQMSGDDIKRVVDVWHNLELA